MVIISANEQSGLTDKASGLGEIRRATNLAYCLNGWLVKQEASDVNVRDVTQINGCFLFLSLSVLSLRLAEECGRPYQLGSEGWRGLLAHSASNKFITPPSVKQSKMLSLLLFHAISGISKSAIIVLLPSGFYIVILCYLQSFCIYIF